MEFISMYVCMYGVSLCMFMYEYVSVRTVYNLKGAL